MINLISEESYVSHNDRAEVRLGLVLGILPFQAYTLPNRSSVTLS